MQLSKKQRRIGLNYAAELAELAAVAPEVSVKREIYKIVNQLRKRYGFSYEEKRDEILKYISLGASTVKDLENETGYDKQEIAEILSDLTRNEIVYAQKLSVTGTGRPALFYVLIERRT